MAERVTEPVMGLFDIDRFRERDAFLRRDGRIPQAGWSNTPRVKARYGRIAPVTWMAIAIAMALRVPETKFKCSGD
jgi:hypothetical protein